MSRKHDDEKNPQEPPLDPPAGGAEKPGGGRVIADESGAAVAQYRIAELEGVLAKHEEADRQNIARIAELEGQVKHLEGQHKLEMLERDRCEAKLREEDDALRAENALFRETLGKRSAEEEAEAAEEAAKGEDETGDQGNAIVAEVMRPDGASLGTPMYLAKGKGLFWTNDLKQARRFRNGRDFIKALDTLREQHPDDLLIGRLRAAVHPVVNL
jgi:hypothetical protein